MNFEKYRVQFASGLLLLWTVGVIVLSQFLKR